NHIKNSIIYTGSHDNDTILGWIEHSPERTVQYAVEYLGLNKEDGYNWGMMRALWSTMSEVTVVQMQDVLGLGSDARLNAPSTVGKNWRWRALPGSYGSELAQKLWHKMELYGRLPE
ncbi:MAG: 4-alpha-glucanotransferase, partial [Lachnospiraceae bacterium]|nr:4-alpha-glucanotransferase [Lachnospiraceae bacterium]